MNDERKGGICEGKIILNRILSILFLGVGILFLGTINPVLSKCVIDAGSFSGTWTGVQQGKYKVLATFNLTYHPALKTVSGTAHFKNTERPVTADAKITSGRVHDDTGDLKVEMVVFYETGLQKGTDVVFDLDILPDCSLKGSGVNKSGNTLTLTLNKKSNPA